MNENDLNKIYISGRNQNIVLNLLHHRRDK